MRVRRRYPSARLWVSIDRIGAEWKRRIGERYSETYDESGNLRADPVKVT